MKAKSILGTSVLWILTTSFFLFSSCTKTSDVSLTDELKDSEENDSEILTIENSDYTETDEDLTTVDYKEFYDQLSPHGEWLQIPVEELGMNANSTSYYNNPQSAGFSVSDIFGVKTAVASTGTSLSMAFVWKPSANLAVAGSIVEGEPVQYVPYTNGRWIYTDAGWYFRAPTPYEEVVHHYGRWTLSPTYGWVWIPGRVWAPAWVVWRENPTYVAWAPAPPSSYLVGGVIRIPVIDANLFVVVEKRNFVQPQIYKYMYKENKNKVMIKEMIKTDGVMIKNHMVYNKGPSFVDIERHWGSRIHPVRINRVNFRNDVRYTDNEIFVYTPVFKRITNPRKVKTIVSKPKNYVKFDDWNKRESAGRESKTKQQEVRKESQGEFPGKKADDKRSTNIKRERKSNDVKGKKNENLRDKKNDGVRSKKNDNVRSRKNDNVRGKKNDNTKGNKNTRQP